MIGRWLRKLTLTELIRMLQEFGTFVVVILLAYVIYKLSLLIEAMGDKIEGEKEGTAGGKARGEKKEIQM